MKLSAESFAAVADLFHRVSGIRFNEDKRTLVAGRLNRLAQERGARDLDAYVTELVRGQDPDEMVRVVDRLTTNETYFFREPRHFDVLERLARDRVGQPGPFRVWSAASSTGEEAYSAAMVLAEVFGPQGWEVIGTDLSTAVVAAARKGLYLLARTEGSPKRLLQRWCRRGMGDYEGRLLIARELRENVHFETANLTHPLPQIGRFDLIFLRNVMIYFETARKQQMDEQVLAHLAHDGLLFVGHAETLSGVTRRVRAIQPAIYERAD